LAPHVMQSKASTSWD